MKTVNPIKAQSKWKPYWLLIKIAIKAFVGIFVISELTLNYLVPVENIVTPPIEGELAWWFTLSFFLITVPIIYFGNSLIGNGFIKLELDRLILYIGLTMFLGNALELLVNHLFVSFIDRPSWLYHIWPKYDGFTSGVTFIMWPLYGFHLYCFHKAMTMKKSMLISSIPIKGIMIGIDAMVMEMIANFFSLVAFKSYFFYYLAGDLNHFTTLEIFIPYVIVGFIIMTIFHFIDRPKFPRLIVGIICLIVGWTVLFSG